MEYYRVALDFGTTYSCIGVWKDGGVEIIPNGLGERTTPSVVIFESPEKVYVGEETLNHLSKKNSVKIYEIKRLIGKRYNEIEDLIRYFAFTIIEDDNGERPLIKITFENGESQEYTPEFIASLIIKKLINNANSYLKQIVSEIIITVPADFSDSQRNGIKFAAESIGIKVIQIINEPSAAVLSYGLPNELLKKWLFPFNKNFSLLMEDDKKDEKKGIYHPMEEAENIYNMENENLLKFSLQTSFMENEKLIIVFDLGGGTYDVSLIEVSKALFETRATAGDQFLGGGDFDNKIMEYCLDTFCHKTSISKEEIENNYKCMQRLKIACERSKIILSIREEDTIYIEDFYKDETLNCPITRAKFEDLCKDCFLKLIPPLDRVLSDTKKKNTDINEIILVGGSSKIPKVKEILKQKFPNVKINESINPDEAVAFGATIFCESLFRNSGKFWEDFEYSDSTQNSYGVELEDGTMGVIIKRGSKYPTISTNYYYNAYDDQYTFNIRVFEGESEYVRDNTFLQEFILEGFPKKKKGELVIEVTFKIDFNQILSVTAHVGEGNARKTVKVEKRKDLFSNKDMNLQLGKISLIGDNLSKEEKKIKIEIFKYSQNFKTMSRDQDKFKLILNYNNSLISYLKFLEEKCSDIESEKYLFLIEKLFKSYSYFYKTQLNAMVDINEKINIKNNIEIYLSKIHRKNPFRLKQLLAHFKGIKINNSEIFYTSSIFSMKLLKNLAEEYFSKKQRNSLQIARNIYEECLLIGKLISHDIYIIDNELMREYNEIKGECEDKIKIISVDSQSEIENTKQTGKLFSNDKNLDYDNLCLLSFNLSKHLKDLNAIDDLNDNKLALEVKSICLANIVKIEFMKNKGNINLQHLYDYSKESISIAEKLGIICTGQEWYKEIIDLHEQIKKKLSYSMPAPSILDKEKMEQELKENLNNGIENFLRFLLINYPYEGCQFSEDMIEEYKNNKRNFLKQLKKKYNNSKIIQSSLNGSNDFNQKKEIIITYLNNCINSISD